MDDAINSDSDAECEDVMTVESLLPKLNYIMKQLLKEHEKVKALTRSNKELMMGLEEYDESYEELRTKYETLAKDHDNLLTRHEKLSLEHKELKVSHKELECSLNKKAPSNTPSSHDGLTCVAKVDASTLYLDLFTMPCASACDNEANLLKENEKPKIDNAKLMDGWNKYTKGYEKASEMMIHQALVVTTRAFV